MRLEMLKYKTGIDILHVPYRGSADALNDLLPGNIQMMNEINVLPHVKAGKLKLLCIQGNRLNGGGIPARCEMGFLGRLMREASNVWSACAVFPVAFRVAGRPPAGGQGVVSFAGDPASPALCDDCRGG
jgi:tripartite-type tricarboxylate transporter receptor subunit TctC